MNVAFFRIKGKWIISLEICGNYFYGWRIPWKDLGTGSQDSSFFYRVSTVSNSESLSGCQNTDLIDKLIIIPRNKQDTSGKHVF